MSNEVPPATISLAPVTTQNRAAVVALRVHDEQLDFIDTHDLDAFLLDSPNHPTYIPFAAVDREHVVGFVSVGLLPQPAGDAWISLLIIDRQYQGAGRGRAVMLAVIDHARRKMAARRIGLAYKPANRVAARLYASLGFISAGDTNTSGEIEAWLTLNDPPFR